MEFNIELIGKPLFKIDQHDNVQLYQCYVKSYANTATIVRRYGLVNGKLQINESNPIEGKNIGKSNETTPYDQAVLEATAMVKEKRDSGYRSFLRTTADFGKNDYAANGELPPVPDVSNKYFAIIYNALLPFKDKGYLGRVQPMLAQDLFKGGNEEYDLQSKTVKRELKKKINFPVAVQAKFDGARCIVDLRDPDKVTLTSREGKDWTKVHHRIVANLKQYLKNGALKPLIYDCELYSDANFQDTIGLIKAPDNYPMFADSLYLVCYDVVDTQKSFQGRYIVEVHNHYIKNSPTLKNEIKLQHDFNTVDPTAMYLLGFRFAITYICHKLSEIKMLHDQFVQAGYEGAMVRVLNSKYEPDKRSANLLKYKVFDCDEFEIAGVEKRKKEVVFKLYNKDNNDLGKNEGSSEYFYCTPPGKKSENKDIELNPREYIGKMLTVKFFGRTKDKLPRFPKGLAIRDYETPDEEE